MSKDLAANPLKIIKNAQRKVSGLVTQADFGGSYRVKKYYRKIKSSKSYAEKSVLLHKTRSELDYINTINIGFAVVLSAFIALNSVTLIRNTTNQSVQNLKPKNTTEILVNQTEIPSLIINSVISLIYIMVAIGQKYQLNTLKKLHFNVFNNGRSKIVSILDTCLNEDETLDNQKLIELICDNLNSQNPEDFISELLYFANDSDRAQIQACLKELVNNSEHLQVIKQVTKELYLSPDFLGKFYNYTLTKTANSPIVTNPKELQKMKKWKYAEYGAIIWAIIQVLILNIR